VPLKTHQDELPAINLTPMIDIVFNLIIFFMVSTRFTEIERKVDLSVPQVGSTSGMADLGKSHVINIYRDGEIVLDGKPVDLAALRARLAAAQRQYADLEVTVRGDGLAHYQHVAAVVTACQQAGISELGMAVAPGRAASVPPATEKR
jgi:biopolymer transport protein ExbD